MAKHYHKKLLHQGYRVVEVDLMKNGILIGGGKDLLKSIASRCMFCRIRRRKMLQQMMGNLPTFRTFIKNAPFASVAIDFFGFLKLRISRNVSINGSVLIVACMTTRCVHLEICSALDTNSFLLAWRRFTSRRGVHPNHVFSDGGGSFIGAYKPLADWIQGWNRSLIATEFEMTKFEFEWKYNVPTASHMNGVVESLINSVQKGLDASVLNYTKHVLTFEDWATVISEVSYIINSRPIFPDGDPWEFYCVTGNDILHPYGQPNLPQLTEEADYGKKMFKTVQNKIDIFWKSWLKYIPPNLNHRNKWFHSRDNLEKGDFVLVLDSGMKMTLPRALWKKAIVTQTHPSDNGLVRSVTIKDSSGSEYLRPIHKLCLLATRTELENSL